MTGDGCELLVMNGATKLFGEFRYSSRPVLSTASQVRGKYLGIILCHLLKEVDHMSIGVCPALLLDHFWVLHTLERLLPSRWRRTSRNLPLVFMSLFSIHILISSYSCAVRVLVVRIEWLWILQC